MALIIGLFFPLGFPQMALNRLVHVICLLFLKFPLVEMEWEVDLIGTFTWWSELFLECSMLNEKEKCILCVSVISCRVYCDLITCLSYDCHTLGDFFYGATVHSHIPLTVSFSFSSLNKAKGSLKKNICVILQHRGFCFDILDLVCTAFLLLVQFCFVKGDMV